MIFITIFAVSMDAYVAGIALSARNRVNELQLFYISSFSFVFPALAVALTSFLPTDISWLNIFSSCILIILGVKGILPEGRKGGLAPLLKEDRRIGFGTLTLLGISLSLDSTLGAAAFFEDPLAPLVPFLLLAAHYLLLFVGRFTVRFLGIAENVARLASAFLILLGILRFF